MRKNPYNKSLKDSLPLFMQSPSVITALITNETQKAFLEKSKVVPPVQKYNIEGVSFVMVNPPFLNPNGVINPQLEMGQTEITQGLFQVVMGWNNSRFKDTRGYTAPQLPVENVTWFDCVSFCNKLSELAGLEPCYEMKKVGKGTRNKDSITSAEVTWNVISNGFRLPTYDEWNIFAKAGTENRWAGTDDRSELDAYAWHELNSGHKTHPVGDKLPNAWGLYDMSGNVKEWCWDKYFSVDEGTFAERVFLGGSGNNSTKNLLSSYRDSGSPGLSGDWLGFRICRTIK